jgi:hypothetical protein
MQIREGAYYRTRGGDVVGPMKPVTVANDAPHPEYVWGCFGRTWTDSGDYDFGAGYLEEDLICEVYVSDTPPVNREITDEQFWGNIKEQQRKATAILGAPEAKTLRDEFADTALKAMLGHSDYVELSPAQMATEAYRQADAMMEARKK